MLTRPQTFTTPPRASEVVSRARTLAGLFRVIDETELVSNNLFPLLENILVGGKQVHDANIVATMQAHGIKHPFTLNPRDFERFTEFITMMTVESIISNP